MIILFSCVAGFIAIIIYAISKSGYNRFDTYIGSPETTLNHFVLDHKYSVVKGAKKENILLYIAIGILLILSIVLVNDIIKVSPKEIQTVRIKKHRGGGYAKTNKTAFMMESIFLLIPIAAGLIILVYRASSSKDEPPILAFCARGIFAYKADNNSPEIVTLSWDEICNFMCYKTHVSISYKKKDAKNRKDTREGTKKTEQIKIYFSTMDATQKEVVELYKEYKSKRSTNQSEVN